MFAIVTPENNMHPCTVFKCAYLFALHDSWSVLSDFVPRFWNLFSWYSSRFSFFLFPIYLNFLDSSLLIIRSSHNILKNKGKYNKDTYIVASVQIITLDLSWIGDPGEKRYVDFSKIQTYFLHVLSSRYLVVV